MADFEQRFQGKDVVYMLIEHIWDEDGPTGEEEILYIGTNYGRSRELSGNLEERGEFRHKVYVDSELVFEAKLGYHTKGQWTSVYDLIDKLEAEVEATKHKLASLTAKLVGLGQR